MKFGELTEKYLTEGLSEFSNKRWVTQRAYRNNIRRANERFANCDLADLSIRDIKAAHAVWSSGGKIPIGHGIITMMRIVLNFGAGILEDRDCQRIAYALRSVKFPNGKRRSNIMTEAQVAAVCEHALIDGARSIALAQTLQWWCGFRQKDIIGEWVPVDADPRPSEVILGELKWVGGITAEEINAERVLTHKTSKRGKVISIPLAKCPLTELEWSLMPKSGPLIIDPETSLPYRVWTFTRQWRHYADLAGVPRSVKNMDTRAGRCTWLLASGANPDDVRKYMTHSRLDTTMIYSRDDDGATNRIAEREREAA